MHSRIDILKLLMFSVLIQISCFPLIFPTFHLIFVLEYFKLFRLTSYQIDAQMEVEKARKNGDAAVR